MDKTIKLPFNGAACQHSWRCADARRGEDFFFDIYSPISFREYLLVYKIIRSVYVLSLWVSSANTRAECVFHAVIAERDDSSGREPHSLYISRKRVGTAHERTDLIRTTHFVFNMNASIIFSAFFLRSWCSFSNSFTFSTRICFNSPESSFPLL